jgi:hypothetical protein
MGPGQEDLLLQLFLSEALLLDRPRFFVSASMQGWTLCDTRVAEANDHLRLTVLHQQHAQQLMINPVDFTLHAPLNAHWHLVILGCGAAVSHGTAPTAPFYSLTPRSVLCPACGICATIRNDPMTANTDLTTNPSA